MKIFGQVPDFDFMGPRVKAMVLSAVLIVASLGSIVTQGLSLGIDFTGGVLLVVSYPQEAPLDDIRTTLVDEGYPGALVQTFGSVNDVMIRLPPGETETDSSIGEDVYAALRARDAGVVRERIDFVDSQVGDDLTEQGGLAMLFALIMIFGYVMLRFRWKFAAGSIAALAHDVVITIGFFSIFRIDFDLSVLAAVLAVIGYSLNDTIVVFDRIRENFRLIRRGTAAEIINASINQTLARTMITGVTTLLVLVALYFLGGEAVRGFSIALIVGIVIGTYSSIYVASAAALALDVSPTDLMPPKREEIDDLP